MLGQNQKIGQNHGQSNPQFPSRLKNSDRATLKTENFGPNRPSHFLILLHFCFFRVPGFMERLAKWFECKANSFKLYPLSLKFASLFYWIKKSNSLIVKWLKGNFVDTQEKCFISLRCLSYCEEEISWSIISESQAWSLQLERHGGVRAPGDVGELEGGGGGSRPEHKVKPRWCWSKEDKKLCQWRQWHINVDNDGWRWKWYLRFITTQIYNK